MSAEQLCFFKFARPLEERFGKAFFKSIPRTPGVYLFLGRSDRVLYVGQSQNLRARLAYYKNAQPEREPRKIIQLVHRTEEIRFELCASPEQALLRENELIRLHRPTYNVVNAKSVIYSYFALRQREEQLELSLHIEPREEDGQRWFGAFKSRGLCRQTLFSLGRWLWKMDQPESLTAYDFPLGLNHSRSNTLFLQPGTLAPSHEQLGHFFGGESSRLLDCFSEVLPSVKDPFARQILEADLLTLANFYEAGPTRAKAIKQEFGLPSLVPKDKLDDFLLLMRRKKIPTS